MVRLSDYQDTFSCAKLRRRDGILEVTLNTDGGPLMWGVDRHNVHAQIGRLFYEIGRDKENRVVILTGAGDTFCVGSHPGDVPDATPQAWDRIYKEGKDLLMNLLDIEVPVIGAINGPAHIHAELLLLSDIVVASDHATIADRGHAPNGIVPGDGVHIVWEMLLGLNRARAFLLTGQILTAAQARDLGIVHEVVEPERLMAAAREQAYELAAKPPLMLRYARVAMLQNVKRRMLDDLGYGLALEGLAYLSLKRPD